MKFDRDMKGLLISVAAIFEAGSVFAGEFGRVGPFEGSTVAILIVWTPILVPLMIGGVVLLSRAIEGDPNRFGPDDINVSELAMLLSKGRTVDQIVLKELGISRDQLGNLTEGQVIEVFNRIAGDARFTKLFSEQSLILPEVSDQLFQKFQKNPSSLMSDELRQLNRAFLKSAFPGVF